MSYYRAEDTACGDILAAGAALVLCAMDSQSTVQVLEDYIWVALAMVDTSSDESGLQSYEWYMVVLASAAVLSADESADYEDVHSAVESC